MTVNGHMKDKTYNTTGYSYTVFVTRNAKLTDTQIDASFKWCDWILLKNKYIVQHSGSIPRNACVPCET